MKKLLQKFTLLSVLSSTLFAGGAGDILRSNLRVDNLEYQFNDEKVLDWDLNGYIGYDKNKLYIYSEGEKAQGVSQNSENQLVYSRAIAPFWDLQVGLDYDKTPNANASWGVLALSGLASYFFQTRIALLVGAQGELGLRIDADYEALLTQKLILTPSFALDAYTQDKVDIELGSGLSNITLGARLRYEIKREFAPYIGVEWSKNFSNTQKISPLDIIYGVAGVKFWF